MTVILRKKKKYMKCDLHQVFTSRKVVDEIKVTELKPPLLNKQCLVYEYKCDLCDAGYRWVIHVEAYFSPFMNISLLSLVNTRGTYKIGGTKNSMTNLQSSRNAFESWIV